MGMVSEMRMTSEGGKTMDKKIVAVFDGDTKRMHRFIIKEGQGVTGSLYFPKDGEKIPGEIVIELRTKAQGVKS